MVVSEIALYNVLRSKYGENDAQTVIEGIKQSVRDEFEAKKDMLATKADIFALKEDMANLRTEIAISKVDIVRWVVATGIALAGIIIAVVKFL